MPRIVGVLLIGFVIFLALGLFLPFVYKARVTSQRVQCQDHFRRIGFATAHADLPGNGPLEGRTEYPAGTLKSNLPIEERISWMVLLLNTLNFQPDKINAKLQIQPVYPYQTVVDNVRLGESWQSPSNRLAAQTRVKFYLCPGNVPEVPAGEPAVTQYVGMAGLGKDTARQSRQDAGRNGGVFLYDESTPISAFADGISNTIAVGETNFQIGPWMAGGPSTVRGIDPGENRYIGLGLSFGGFHLGGGNFGMADGSVRFISDKIHPGIFRAMTTIAGRETAFE